MEMDECVPTKICEWKKKLVNKRLPKGEGDLSKKRKIVCQDYEYEVSALKWKNCESRVTGTHFEPSRRGPIYCSKNPRLCLSTSSV